MKMLTNYLASVKTRKPFCGMECCGNKFGVHRMSPGASRAKTSPSRLMRRYAKHADNRMWRREVEQQLHEANDAAWAAIESEANKYEALMDYDNNRLSMYENYDDSWMYDSHDYDTLERDSDHVQYHNLYSALQEAHGLGYLSTRKYYKMLAILNERD